MCDIVYIFYIVISTALIINHLWVVVVVVVDVVWDLFKLLQFNKRKKRVNRRFFHVIFRISKKVNRKRKQIILQFALLAQCLSLSFSVFKY